jgi:hypothetical protein
MGTKPFEFVDLTDEKTQASYSFDDEEMTETSPSIARTIGYLQNLINRHKKGEVYNMTVIALLKDDRVSIWLPATIGEGDLDTLYDPIILALKNSNPDSEFN